MHRDGSRGGVFVDVCRDRLDEGHMPAAMHSVALGTTDSSEYR